MTAQSVEPCTPWPIYWTCDVSTYSPTLTGIAVSTATHILWALSGRRFGTCSVTLRPCSKGCNNATEGGMPGGGYAWPWSAYGSPLASAAWDGSFWFPQGCGNCAYDNCSCTYVAETLLPSPVADVTAVKVDGALLPSSSYRLDNGRILVRTDGPDWPWCNDLTKDDTQVGTWSVTADYGLAVPSSAQGAMGQMACEILKGMVGANDCGLPTTVTHLLRQGVDISFPDINALLTEGRTGLYLVDLFLAAVNPYKLQERARVYAVDSAQSRRTST